MSTCLMGLLLSLCSQRKDKFRHSTGKNCMRLLLESLGESIIYTRKVMCALHLEIKPQNILLDHYFIPKITNVGMVKFHPKKRDLFYSTPALKSRKVVGSADARKSDVYRFAMLILAMTGRKI